MNTIRGWVIVKESDLGIPRLLVEILDRDPNTTGEEPGRSGDDGDRLGCVVTNTPDGSFELRYDDTEFQVRNAERRPDLVLRVLAPEEPGKTLESRILYTSTEVRQNAGLIEHYVIRLPTDQLLKHGIPLPSTVARESEPAPSVIARIKENAVRHEEITEAAFGAAKQRMDAHRVRFAGFDRKIKPSLLGELSTVSPNTPDPDRFVRRGDSPFEKTTSSMRKMIRERINSDDPAKRPSAKGIVTLTPDQVNELRALADADGSVPASAVNEVAEKNGRSARISFVEANGQNSLCVPKTPGHECAIALLEPHEPPILGPSPDGDGAVTAISAADIPRYLARLMEPVTAPEEDLLVGLMPVATHASVQNAVQKLIFPPSPADVPAFHDITSLHLAFDTVWQEMLDEGLVDLVQDAYETIVELGGDPTRDDHRGVDAITAVVREGRAAMKATRRVRDHRGDGPDPNPPGGVSVTPTAGGRRTQPHRCSGAEDSYVVVRDHRNGTTDTVVRDHRTTRTDPAERLPDLLQQLEKRLLGKYAFTVFAANGKERSINFGLLNTWRQVWTPLNYQAGPMVKSIPLAPRQTQKVVISRKTIKKRTRKELENNLRVLKDEMSSTSRTEQEIARRAQTKNDFSIENATKGGVEAASHTTTIKAGHEASKSSDDIKKSFHESVFKSAQEVKQERVVEVNAEDIDEFESVETTEISNPNDEIACTFLFYELERCYRVREQLHRCVPVVLVAQEFPQPHEINAAWLIAHDWILKRVILDDSFLPTLNSLAQTAGNESALAEMRINVQQQRCIVEQLREEVASARSRATLQQALIERSVFQKAGVVSGDGRGGGGGDSILGLVGDALEGVASAAGSLADSVGDLIFGGEPSQNQSNRQAMQDRAQEAADQARELMFRLEREVTALNALTESYTKALREHHILLTEVARCCGHVMDNIMYYMHKIWLHEPDDQRYFRLFNVPVPLFKTAERKVKIDFDHPLAPMGEAHKTLPRFGGVETNAFRTDARTKLLEDMEFAPLSDVADLDKLLGFKGNYMIFALRESNALTDLMMDPYLDRATGELVDPSDPSRWSLEEFADYVCCLKEHLTEEELQAILPRLREQYKAILSTPMRNGDVLVVPTNSLFIQALPDTHEVLGNFKRAHRLIDVKAAQAAHREKELENVRRAARLLAGERGDPNIDKRVLIQGADSIVVPADA